jgi:mono/diheme cytochrome c family protein
LLFAGDVAGRFRAYDQHTGAVLWQTPLGAQVTGFPITYSVNDRQYVAVSVGQAVNTAQYLALTPEIRPGNVNVLYVFALPPGWQPGSTSRITTPPPIPVVASGPVPALSTQASSCRRTGNGAGSSATAAGTTAAPLFSAARLSEGRRVYTDQQCAVCHGENLRGSGSAPALADPGFKQAWAGRSVRELFDCVKTTMPPGRTGELSDADITRVLGVILEANGWNDPGAAPETLPDTATLASRPLPRTGGTNAR